MDIADLKFGDVIEFEFATKTHVAMVVLSCAEAGRIPDGWRTDEGTGVSDGTVVILGLRGDGLGMYHQEGMTATLYGDFKVLS